MLKLNVVPFPTSDFTSIFPPKAWTICYEIISPKPMPCLLIGKELWSFPNTLNSFSIPFGEIPTPVSFTSTISFDNLMLTIIDTLPSEVNLSAFDYKFKITCWSLSLSAYITGLFSTFSSKIASRVFSCDYACSFWRFTTSITASLISNI